MQQVLLVVSTAWFVVLAGTILLAYYYSCAILAQQAQGREAPRTTVPMPVPPQSGRSQRIAPGTRVRGYRVKAELGEGGCARVYLAERLSDGRLVALKVGTDRKRWRHERKMLGCVRHRAFPLLLGAFHAAQGYFLVQEYVPGVDLDHLLEERGALALPEVLDLGVQLAEALASLHGLRQPIIHRDLKPGNVRLMVDGRVRLLDLGIAQRGKRPGPCAGWGTPEYMAPEALAQQPCLASDIYALGVTLWEVLTGQSPDPLAGSFPALPAPGLPGLSITLSAMLSRDPAERPTASALLEALVWLRRVVERRAA